MVSELCDLKSTGVGGKPFFSEHCLSPWKKDLCPTTSEDLLKISALLNIFAVTIIFEKRIFNNNKKKILFSAAPERIPTSCTNVLLQSENSPDFQMHKGMKWKNVWINSDISTFVFGTSTLPLLVMPLNLIWLCAAFAQQLCGSSVCLTTPLWVSM